jgi:hypothetical protein
MKWLADHFLGFAAEHPGRGRVHKGAISTEIQAKDSLANGVQDESVSDLKFALIHFSTPESKGKPYV